MMEHIYYDDKRKVWRYIIRKRAVESLGGKCANCGISFDNPSLFDFHHINNDKDFTIASINMTSPKKWLVIRDELRKCCLLCPNCHRGYHCGEINIKFKKKYFDETYYDWDVVNYKNSILTEELEVINRCKNIKRYDKKEYVCPICGGPKSFEGQICHFCLTKLKRDKIPPEEELVELIHDLPIAQASKRYCVSDTTFRNWLEYRGLPSHKKEIDIFFGRVKEKKPKKEKINRMVEQYTLKGEYINTYDSCSAAGTALGNIQYNKHINECANNKRKSAYGFIWKYK